MTTVNKWLGRMPAADYHADKLCDGPTLSAHTAITLAEDCPKRAWFEHPRLGASKAYEASEDQEEGSLINDILLGVTGPGKFVGIEANDFRTKAAQTARDEARAAGKIPLLVKKYERLSNACDRIKENLLREGVDFSQCATEQALLWTAESAGGVPVQCRSMLDAFQDGRQIWELKKCESANPKKVRRAIEGYGYAVQQHAYRLAAETVLEAHGRIAFDWVFVEIKAPYLVNVCPPAGSMRELGRVLWESALDTWAHCLRTGEWPGYQRAAVEASPWALADACAGGLADE